MAIDPPPEMIALIDAGFTSEELRGIATDLMFAAALAAAGETGTIPASSKVEWTLEKRRAWDKMLSSMFGPPQSPSNY